MTNLIHATKVMLTISIVAVNPFEVLEAEPQPVDVVFPPPTSLLPPFPPPLTDPPAPPFSSLFPPLFPPSETPLIFTILL